MKLEVAVSAFTRAGSSDYGVDVLSRGRMVATFYGETAERATERAEAYVRMMQNRFEE